MCTNTCLKALRFSGTCRSYKDFCKEYTYTCDKHLNVFTPGADVIRCMYCAEWTFNLGTKVCGECRADMDKIARERGKVSKLGKKAAARIEELIEKVKRKVG